MPSDTGLAFVVIQHPDPSHNSEMALLLARCTQMVVTEALNRAWVEPNHVYVIPPNRKLAISNGRLSVTQPREKRGSRMAIDFFFRSLALDCRERGIGIVFSGAGSDGTLGLQEIREAGGLTIAQDPSTAAQQGMSRSAIARGVDFVLPVQKIPEQLLKYVRHPYLRYASDTQTNADKSGIHIQPVLSLLRTRGKLDFSNYKTGTLERRVQRRMTLRHIIQFSDYLELLRRDSNEINQLLKDLLICVTHFFRDGEAWNALQETAVRTLVAGKSDDESIRAWVPGCATGEEAYSLGMLILDELHAAGKRCKVSIFASDVNREAFSIARLGVYSEDIADDVPVERLRRYFLHEKEQYRVRDVLRDAVVFAEQNLLSDPPFSRLDLISCRNVMIYLDAEAQSKLIALFHYSLREAGVLFLGGAETVGDSAHLFRTISRKFRIYRRVDAEPSNALDFRLSDGRVRPRTSSPVPPSRAAADRLTELAQQIILDRCAPASAVIDQKDQIVYTCGRIEDYLKQPAGIMHTLLLSWVNESTRFKLRAALREARRTGRMVTVAGVRTHAGTARGLADITVEQLKAPRRLEGFSLITFRSVQAATPTTPVVPIGQISVEGDSTVRRLEDELRTTREDLQTIIDELATSNEDLRACNEEVTSGNEELQSTNEELETSKEELQSLNDELSTVNGELQEKVKQLEAKTNDLNNLLTSTDIATIFLDRRFHIKWFSGSSTRLLNLRTSDIGRPIGDLAIKVIGVDLLRDARAVLRKLSPLEREIRGQEGHWYLRRMLPYRTADDHIEGLVITFVDIHGSKLADEKLRRMAAVLRDCNDAVTVQDFDGRILAWNHGAEVMYGYTEEEALRRNGIVMIPASKRPEMRSVFRQLKRKQKIVPLEIQRRTKAGKILDVWLTVSALLDDDGHPTAIATTERDITQRKLDETSLRELNQSLEKRVAERSALAEQQARRLRELTAQLLMTAERERRSLAEDLHDNLSQVLHVAKLKLSEMRSETKDIAQSALFIEVENLLARANQSARSLSYQLSPPVLHELGLVPALEWLAEEMGRLFRLEVKVTRGRDPVVVDEQARIALFRSARELLMNVAKHAGVRRASLRVRRNREGVVITVEDRGVGFDAKLADDSKRNRGLGLFSIRERLNYLGGRMEIRSNSRKTSIELAMPLAKDR